MNKKHRVNTQRKIISKFVKKYSLLKKKNELKKSSSAIKSTFLKLVNSLIHLATKRKLYLYELKKT